MIIVYSGSFNPWHDGHTKVAEDIQRRFGIAPILELNFNASQCTGKNAITGDDVVKRFRAMPDYRKVATPFALFTDKADYIRQILNLPREEKIWFVCGSDTIKKLDEWVVAKTPAHANHNLECFLASNFGMIAYPRFKDETLEINNEQLNHRTILINNFTPLEISSTEIRNANTKRNTGSTVSIA